MNTILHLVNQSPTSSICLKQCLDRCTNDDGIALFGDGVYGATDPAIRESLGQYTVYILAEDFNARGLTEDCLTTNAKLIDYKEFVQLSIDYTSSLSWY